MNLNDFRYPLRIALLLFLLAAPALLDLFGPGLSSGSHPFQMLFPYGVLAATFSLPFGGKRHFLGFERLFAVACLTLAALDVIGASRTETIELDQGFGFGILRSALKLALLPVADPDHSVAPWIVMGFCPVLLVMGGLRIRKGGLRALLLMTLGATGYALFALTWIRLHQGSFADAVAVLIMMTPLFGIFDFLFVMWLYAIGPFAECPCDLH